MAFDLVIVIVVAALGLIGFELFRWRQRRVHKVKRRDRQRRNSAHQKAWDMVFGYRSRRRLTYRGRDGNAED